MTPYLSIVIPVYNERENVPLLIKTLLSALDRLEKPSEIIFVDDGSRDGTGEVLREMSSQYPRVTAILLRRNFGQTAALSAGIDHARGEIIVVMDGDLQNDPQDIPLLLEKLSEGYDVVSGWRRDRQDAFFTRILPSKIANALISRVTGVSLHDYGCSLKAYRADVIKETRLYGDLHRFIPTLASITGARIAEVPVTHHPRHSGKSKYTLNRVFRVLMDLIIVSFLKSFAQRPFHIFGWTGIFLLAVGGIIDGYLAFLKIFTGASLANRPLLLLGTLLILAGLQITSLGILAELQIRTYHESQGRPIYSIREIIGRDS
jgi:glycosyltransferase involved in cell wall biosynthesis